MQRLEYSLECPITFALFTDPITLPECGHSFEREAIKQHCDANEHCCPTCRKDINIPIMQIPTAFNLRDLADELRFIQNNEPKQPTANTDTEKPSSKLSQYSIFLRSQIGKIEEYSVKPSDKIKDIRLKVLREHHYCCPKQVALIFSGKDLKDDSTVNDNHIHDKDTIYFQPRLPCPCSR